MTLRDLTFNAGRHVDVSQGPMLYLEGSFLPTPHSLPLSFSSSSSFLPSSLQLYYFIQWKNVPQILERLEWVTVGQGSNSTTSQKTETQNGQTAGAQAYDPHLLLCPQDVVQCLAHSWYSRMHTHTVERQGALHSLKGFKGNIRPLVQPAFLNDLQAIRSLF